MVKKKYTPLELEELMLEEFKDKIENSQKEARHQEKEKLSQEDYDKFTKEITIVIDEHTLRSILESTYQEEEKNAGKPTMQ